MNILSGIKNYISGQKQSMLSNAGFIKAKNYEIADLDQIADVAYNSDVFYNIPISNDITVPMILVGSNGVFVFADYGEDSKESRLLILKNKILAHYHFDRNTAFFGISETKEAVYFINENGTLFEIDDLITKFNNYYANSLRPRLWLLRHNVRYTSDKFLSEEELEAKDSYKDIASESCIEEDETYVEQIVSDENIDYFTTKIEDDINHTDTGDTRVDSEGNVYHKHAVISKFGSLATGEAYFRDSYEDADRTFLNTLFGGIFGIHHFLRGNFGKGLLYLFTCGEFGIGYISDVFELAFGNYSYDEVYYGTNRFGKPTRQKEKVYLKPVSYKKAKIFGPILSIIIAAVMILFVLRPAVGVLNDALTNVAVETVTSVAEDAVTQVMPNK